MFQQSVPGLAGQRESAVLVVRDARVPQRASVLLEVSLLGHAAGPIHSCAGIPADIMSRTFKFQARCATNKHTEDGKQRGRFLPVNTSCQSEIHASYGKVSVQRDGRDKLSNNPPSLLTFT